MHDPQREAEAEKKLDAILNAVHAFFTGAATLWVGQLPVRFELNADKKEG